ncbi:MAG TPA: deoxyribodipyrimidine photo-lyase [Acidimicrobiia bacterium]|nr:deoxyribodipyrimidine photo-lyase [Acidimicrobiia bacterium]
MSHAIAWFRADLRLDDNPAWATATASADQVTALFVIDPRPMASAGRMRRRALLAHLAALDRALARHGGRLRIEQGDPVEIVPRLAQTLGAGAVHVNSDVTPYAGVRDAAVSDLVPLAVHDGRYVHAPGSVTTGKGGPYRVFSPFFRRWRGTPVDAWPDPGGARVADDPGSGVTADPSEGEAGARRRLDEFLERSDDYAADRDRLDRDATSRLSTDLRFGVISPRMVAVAASEAGADAFLRQVAWREFCAQLLQSDPDLATRPLDRRFEQVRWRDDPEGLRRWKAGETGFPIVDAGMRQLAAEGWMNNRLRMITASFLVKDLLIDWRLGERHFRRLLVDGDLPQNVINWQWVAGVGVDAAPYFRVMNPVLQAERHDPDGEHVRRWVPELGAIDGPGVHAPWLLADGELSGVRLGVDYPLPIVDHAEARREAIAAYEAPPTKR